MLINMLMVERQADTLTWTLGRIRYILIPPIYNSPIYIGTTGLSCKAAISWGKITAGISATGSWDESKPLQNQLVDNLADNQMVLVCL